VLIVGSSPEARVFTVRQTPAVLARVPLRAAEDDTTSHPYADGVLSEAMFLASRRLGQTVATASHGRKNPPSRRELTGRAYELRSRWRPTPHGAFAGVSIAQVAGAGEPSALRLGADHRAHTNPSGAWLAALGDLLMADLGVLCGLRLTASNLVTHRGGRLETEWRTRRVTVRATEAVLFIMRLCAEGAVTADVVHHVGRRWQVPEPVITATLAELIRDRFLLADLLPADVSRDPLGHLLTRIPCDHVRAEELRRLRRLLTDADRSPVGDTARLKALTTARELADAVRFVESPLSVDVAADAQIIVSPGLLEEAAQAAGALWWGESLLAPLAKWHDRFAKRYGPDRLVPLLEATDTAVGLGIDTVDIERVRRANEVADPGSARRTQLLATLLTHALITGDTEVVIDDVMLGRLAGSHTEPPPRSGEIGVRVITSRPQDLAAGRFRLAVVPPGSDNAGSTMGRFSHLLPGAWPGEPDVDPVMLVAEIVVQTRLPEGAALAPPTGFAQCRIPIGVPALDGDLDLADLHLVSDGKRLRCWSARHQRLVIPVLYSRLAPHMLPPIARFLQLLGYAGSHPVPNWSWGALAHGPFQPRVRYRRTILAPARWVLPPPLVETVGDRNRWDVALDGWRATAMPSPPAVVVTDDGDHRLPLDLRRADDRELLRRYVRRGLRAICEPPGGSDTVQAVVTGSAGRHVLELVIPLQARQPFDRPPTRPYLARPSSVDGPGVFLPGGSWLSLAIRAPVTCQDDILIQLADIAKEMAEHLDTWFWLRFADQAQGPHLRVRFRGDPSVLGGVVLPAISTWCTNLIRQRLSGGFSIEPYDQELERYGGPDVPMERAERAFAADSRLVLAILAETRDADRRLIAAAMSAAAIAATLADGQPLVSGRPHLDRAARRTFEALRPRVRAAGSLRNPADVPEIVSAHIPADAWAARNETLAAYIAVLKPTRRAPCAASLIHMHANRLLGDGNAERIAVALAADLLTRTAVSG
jgi:thiopeptide-type bacteriocin biosynthesis protein